ncbi:MAG: hypothetical protein QM398_02815 [Thermoproteota archaeon]|nr:hypothetical protein [Thermoproteota archaeon]NLD67112.1 hypothetical protein [Thermoproteota archaeon]
MEAKYSKVNAKVAVRKFIVINVKTAATMLQIQSMDTPERQGVKTATDRKKATNALLNSRIYMID